MKIKRCLLPALWLLFPSSAFSASVMPVFTTDVYVNTGAQGTQMYRADLTGLGLTEVGSIKITDSNSGVGGSSGLYSGFDLDAIFLDEDGLLSTNADRYFASSFLYAAGAVRGGGSPVSSSGGPFNGASSASTVDEAFATLNDIDAIFFGAGSVTLGDGGSLIANFLPEVTLGSSLYLFVGEVSGDVGENVNGLIEVSDDPQMAVPLPATAPMLLGALGLFGMLKRRRARG